MRRKITELEKNLIDKGFKLSYKTYSGKHSQFVEHYVYSGVLGMFDYEECNAYEIKDLGIKDFEIKVVLDQKRVKIEDVLIKNSIKEYVDKSDIDTLIIALQYIENFLKGLTTNEE